VKVDEFDYELPPELIAAHPREKRDDSRMLVVDRTSGRIEHASIRDLPGMLRPGDLTVLNNTRVVPARFFSRDGGAEILRVEALTETRWRCLVKPGKKFRPGRTIEIGDCTGVVVEIFEDGHRIIEFDRAPDSDTQGKLALPPYLGREEEPADRERYQSVFASRDGAIAAPTASLHLTSELLGQLPHVFLTLHVGIGTFLPVKTERVEDHRMHEEWYEVDESAARVINAAEGVLAVGTTVVRVLETCAGEMGVRSGQGTTDLFIREPFRFRIVDALLTNFHLPKSTLLMLVSAFAGRELIREAYAKAIEERYRFFSYGDCMWIR